MQAQIDLSGILPTPSTGINLNAEINNSDTFSPTLLCDLKYISEVLLKWHSTIKSPCIQAKFSDYQSQMVHSTSLFSSAQCDTLF